MNQHVLHKYANEDVSLGSWFIRLDVDHIDDRRLCCGTPLEDFSYFNKLGDDGFGSVYKGKLSNRQMIAMKRLSKDSGQRDREFRNEVQLLAELQHQNLVKLLGFCLKRSERI
ncbi:Cysteine-rich receptor-like protein kinase [Arachis hypogaea]|nr:Cysteine-rich receptor-like protein kinase [Arachis hypogaea]